MPLSTYVRIFSSALRAICSRAYIATAAAAECAVNIFARLAIKISSVVATEYADKHNQLGNSTVCMSAGEGSSKTPTTTRICQNRRRKKKRAKNHPRVECIIIVVVVKKRKKTEMVVCAVFVLCV